MSYEAFKDNTLGFTTRQLHAGYNPSEHFKAKAVPIYQTAAFELGDYERCLRLFKYEEEGDSYVRFSNPTNRVLEKRISSLEGGSAAVSLASGMAAISDTFLTLAKSGDNIVSVPTLYGGTTTLLQKTLSQYGIEGRFIEDPDDVQSYSKYIDDRTKALYIEALGNPGMNVLDVDAITDLAHSYGVPVVIDNTFATPYLFRPFEHGVDIACYSATKYLSGHGVNIAGIVTESGKFNFRNGRFPQFDEFYEEFKDWIDAETLEKEIFTKRLRITYLTDLGAHMSPQTAFYVLQGMETLSLRMDRHVSNAQKLAEFLDSHEKVTEVLYPGLKSSPYYELAKKYFPKGPGAIMSIRVKGGRDAALKVLEKVRIFDYMTNVGDAKSLIVHPESSTHFGHSAEENAKAGVYPDSLRLSVGIEDIDDLIRDIDQALSD
ncbi:MAG: PLP-dependent transferase [Butyrivibrio sp.]|nr:PLP-dependent transferase [Butyrivibrio sp.]